MSSDRVKRLAQVAAMRAIAMVGDPEAYRQRLNDFQLGYLTGHTRGLRRAAGPPAPAGDVTAEVLNALEQSVRLQSHYAELLNAHDGGRRKTFHDADAWIKRLRGLSQLQGDLNKLRTTGGIDDGDTS